MTVRDERWRLVVLYASGRRIDEEAASHPLIGLDERTVCRIFGFKGSHVPSLPVDVHADHLSELQAFAANPIRLPSGTRAELVLDHDASSSRDVIPLLAITVLLAVVTSVVWTIADGHHGGVALALHVVAIVTGLAAAWSFISTLLVVGVVRAEARQSRRR